MNVQKEKDKIVKTGDVVLVTIPNSIGHQQGGTRYAVVVSNNIGNSKSPTVEVLPSTTKRDGKMPTHAMFKAGEIEGLNRDTVFEAESKWTVNKFQILQVITSLTEEQMKRIAEAMLYATPCIIVAFENGIHLTEKFKKISRAY